VSNAFTEHIAQGKTTMDKAQVNVDSINARLKTQDQQAQSADGTF
jgi:hypothetical protein